MRVVASKQRMGGFSLVELMVAMVLGLVLIAAVLQVFLGNRQTQVMESSLARVQEAGRLALDFIGEDLRLAGFYGAGDLKYTPIPIIKDNVTGCAIPGRTANPDVLNVALGTGYEVYDEFVDQAVMVYTKTEDASWAPNAPPDEIIPASVQADARPGSDVISVWYGLDTGAQLTTPARLTDNVSITYLSNTTQDRCFRTNELALLSNPAGAILFKVTNAVSACTGTVILQHATTGNCSNSLGSQTYDTFARVMKVVHRVYYVKDTGRNNAEGADVYSLYRYQFANGGSVIPDVELVEGIEFLKLTYNQRKLDGSNVADGKVRFDVSAASVDAKSIKSARIGVLVQGLDPVRTDADTRTYTLVNGASIEPPTGTGTTHSGGRTLRQVFSTNVELRNRAQ